MGSSATRGPASWKVGSLGAISEAAYHDPHDDSEVDAVVLTYG